VSNEQRDRYINYTRYLTYFGLCIATCIVFQSSTWMAALIGLSVAIYITVSEYWLKTTPAPAANTPQPMAFEVNN
jgi:protein disulfide-isomerase